MIAFTKIDGGRFHIGVMRTDGSGEKLLTGSYLDEGPTWAPNGRVLMFFRESPGASGGPQLYSVDITGRNLRRCRRGLRLRPVVVGAAELNDGPNGQERDGQR